MPASAGFLGFRRKAGGGAGGQARSYWRETAGASGRKPALASARRQARNRGIAVVFHLHNFGYRNRSAFVDCSAVIFPSEYSRRHHARLIELDGRVIPDPIPLDRIVAENPQPTYATFINPQPPNGMTVFARIALDKLWHNQEFESSHRALARAEARRTERGRVADQFERMFRSLGRGATAR
jgi:hypothetical protein